MKELIRRLPILLIIFVVFMTGCSNSNSSEDKSVKMSDKSNARSESAQSGSEQADFYSNEAGKAEKTTESTATLKVQNQMVIYQADLALRVKKI